MAGDVPFRTYFQTHTQMPPPPRQVRPLTMQQTQQESRAVAGKLRDAAIFSGFRDTADFLYAEATFPYHTPVPRSIYHTHTIRISSINQSVINLDIAQWTVVRKVSNALERHLNT